MGALLEENEDDMKTIIPYAYDNIYGNGVKTNANAGVVGDYTGFTGTGGAGLRDFLSKYRIIMQESWQSQGIYNDVTTKNDRTGKRVTIDTVPIKKGMSIKQFYNSSWSTVSAPSDCTNYTVIKVPICVSEKQIRIFGPDSGILADDDDQAFILFLPNGQIYIYAEIVNSGSYTHTWFRLK